MNYPSGSLLAHVPIGGAINRGINTSASDLGYYFKMNGKGIFRLTTKHIDTFLSNLEQQTNITLNEFDYIISASIPLGLEKYYNELDKKTGQKILLFGSGAGVSLGAIVLQFE